jgi:hypothetical protein
LNRASELEMVFSDPADAVSLAEILCRRMLGIAIAAMMAIIAITIINSINVKPFMRLLIPLLLQNLS